jgi:hypothetical protein
VWVPKDSDRTVLYERRYLSCHHRSPDLQAAIHPDRGVILWSVEGLAGSQRKATSKATTWEDRVVDQFEPFGLHSGMDGTVSADRDYFPSITPSRYPSIGETEEIAIDVLTNRGL